MSVRVGQCPCGAAHDMADDVWAAFERATAGLPADVNVVTGTGTFTVPRVYIACHGLRAAEVPELAGRYGFGRLA